MITKVLEMEESEADKTLTYTLREFSKRHRNLTHKFLKHYRKALELVAPTFTEPEQVSMVKKLLIGSYSPWSTPSVQLHSSIPPLLNRPIRQDSAKAQNGLSSVSGYR